MTASHLFCTFLMIVWLDVHAVPFARMLSFCPSWARTLLLSAMKWWAGDCRALLNSPPPCTGQRSNEAIAQLSLTPLCLTKVKNRNKCMAERFTYGWSGGSGKKKHVGTELIRVQTPVSGEMKQ